MSKDIHGVNFVTDDNTGGYFVMQCQSCDEVFNSKSCDGGEPNADAGDYGDAYCPHCGQVDPEECDNPNLVWNVQQKKINELLVALEFVMSAHGYQLDVAFAQAQNAIAKAKGGAA
ncbi:TPA: hypothetical protein F3L08_12850 [Aeromonas hydrophila]|nr:hypothetical protein [Aeromonas hydrophila]HAU4975607.1 hypothetical protein [Aeromonas hydrophila]HAU4984564.1 hypothetical protein [Aeromonas hydrophila]